MKRCKRAIGFNGTNKCQVILQECKKPKTITVEEMREMLDRIIQDDKETILQVPLIDLIWTIICYSKEMKEYEDGAFMGKGGYEHCNNLLEQREYSACRRDELARIISQYSDFDTERIWKEVDKIFTKIDLVYNGDEEL